MWFFKLTQVMLEQKPMTPSATRLAAVSGPNEAAAWKDTIMTGARPVRKCANTVTLAGIKPGPLHHSPKHKQHYDPDNTTNESARA